jgi:hypothetical protein
MSEGRNSRLACLALLQPVVQRGPVAAQDSERARHERCEALRAELVRRGRSAEEAEAAVEENPGLSRVTW